MEDKQAPATTYWDFIRVNDLLSLQGGLEHDEAQLENEEVLFITVHQIFELWFKLILRELRVARDLFTAPHVAEHELSGAVSGLRRVTSILRVACHHFEVVETLDTRAYLAFRDKLMPASGFQSAQMRQMEILLGLEDKDRISLGIEGSHLEALRSPDGAKSTAYKAVENQMQDRPTLKEAIDAWMLRTPIDGVPHDAPDAEEQLYRFIDRYLEAHAAEVGIGRERALQLSKTDTERARFEAMYKAEIESVRNHLRPDEANGGARRARIRAAILFLDTYPDLALLAWPREVLASLLELEQAFVIFRQRHARMVERVIGRRTGTGGSAGVDYLDKTALTYRIFEDLWATRTLLVRPVAAPKLENEAFYG
ncbi:MAG: tryptophan 2,3-dioxygenase, partial [Planctomycetota bacterium]